jgi:hypothetical protein
MIVSHLIKKIVIQVSFQQPIMANNLTLTRKKLNFCIKYSGIKYIVRLPLQVKARVPLYIYMRKLKVHLAIV